jgi:hypothetical protein
LQPFLREKYKKILSPKRLKTCNKHSVGDIKKHRGGEFNLFPVGGMVRWPLSFASCFAEGQSGSWLTRCHSPLNIFGMRRTKGLAKNGHIPVES